MLISMAFAAEEKTVQKRGLLNLGYGLGGLGLSDGLYGGDLGHGKLAVAVQEKAVAVPYPVPRPYPVAVDRPVPVKVRKFYMDFLCSCHQLAVTKPDMLY